MLRFPAVLLLALAAGACSPTFNWREVRVESTTLKAMLPCKPDKGMRRVTMGAAQVELSGIGCDTGGATFAVLHAELGDPARADEVLAQWNRATLANLHGTTTGTRPFTVPGATPKDGTPRTPPTSSAPTATNARSRSTSPSPKASA